jgi:hypothetical protein
MLEDEERMKRLIGLKKKKMKQYDEENVYRMLRLILDIK